MELKAPCGVCGQSWGWQGQVSVAGPHGLMSTGVKAAGAKSVWLSLGGRTPVRGATETGAGGQEAQISEKIDFIGVLRGLAANRWGVTPCPSGDGTLPWGSGLAASGLWPGPSLPAQNHLQAGAGRKHGIQG